MFHPTRRQMIGGLAASALIGPQMMPQAARAQNASSPNAGGNDGLITHAQAGNRFYGCALDVNSVRKDAALMSHVNLEAGLLGGENCFKFDTLHPAPTKYDFRDGDALVKYATDHGKSLRGHTFLWHQAMPKWLTKNLTKANAEQILEEHIKTVLTHYEGKMLQWDVANEVIEPDDNQPGGMRNSLWYQMLGQNMLDIAFHAAAAIDPRTMLTLNEYGLDYAWDPHKRRREAVLELLNALKSRGVPVQALGIQAHLEAGVKELDQNLLRQFCTDVAGLGIKIIITEMDVRDNRLPADIPSRDMAVAMHAGTYLDAMLDSPDVLGVVSWGLSDKHTWLNTQYPRADKLPQRPLPLDDKLNRKPLWQAMAAAFDTSAKVV